MEQGNQQPTTIVELLEKINDAITDIKRGEGNDYKGCIFRGEPQKFGKVSSGLYRRPKAMPVKQVKERLRELLAEYDARDDEEVLTHDQISNDIQSNIDDNQQDTNNPVAEGHDENALKSLQEDYLSAARGWIGSARSNIEILVELQHYGGKTNLIDFSESYLVALFFACRDDNYRQKDGQLIILSKRNVELVPNYGSIPQEKSFIVHPLPDNRRAFIQRSVMLHEPKGYLEGGKEIEIPLGLKKAILDYLIEFCDISDKTLFPDIQGYIEVQKFIQQERFRSETQLVWASKLWDEIKPESKLARASRLLDEKEYDEPIAIATRKIQEGEDVNIWSGFRAQVYQFRAQIHLAKAQPKLALEDNEKALSDFDRAIELDDKNAVSYAARAETHMQLKNYKNALSDCDRAIELDNKNYAFYMTRSRVHMALRDSKGMLSDFDCAIALNDKNAMLYAARADVYLELQEYGKALSDFARAIDLDDKNFMLRAGRASIYFMLKEYDKALLDYDRTIELGGEDILFFLNRALVRKNRVVAYDVQEEKSKELGKARSDLNVALNMTKEKRQPKLTKLIQRHLGELDKLDQK